MTGLPNPELEPTLDVPRAGALLGLSRSSAYEAARQYLESDGAAGLPVLKLTTRTLRVPTARLLEMLGARTNGNGAQRE